MKIFNSFRPKTSALRGIFLLLILFSFTGCEFIGGVFQTGVGIGAFVVIVIVILILAVRGMGRRR